MTYKLAFNESALKEWKKLGHTIQEQFKKKLRERLENPRVPASQLHGRKDQYKIKLRGAGYRLVYSVEDEIITVTVIGVGKRENVRLGEPIFFGAKANYPHLRPSLYWISHCGYRHDHTCACFCYRLY